MDTYEKKYNEALEKAKNIYKEGVGMDVIQYLFPELRESEDERIRKEIIGYLNSRVPTAEETELLYFKRWIAWLEKQKEQKPAEGLEEEIINYFGRMPDDEDKIALARHFYELGSSEKPNNHEGLDEAAEGIYKTRFYTRADDFKAGAEWAMDNLPKWRESSKEYYTDKPKVYEGFGQFKLFWKDRVIDINKVFETLPKK